MKQNPPCKTCPFRAKYSGDQDYLRPGRRAEIALSVIEGAGFPCHKTVTYEGDAPKQEQPCTGLDIVMLRADVAHQSQMFRIRERLGVVNAQRLLRSSKQMKLWTWDDILTEGEELGGEPCSIAGVDCEAPAGWVINGNAMPSGMVTDNYCPQCGEPVCESCEFDPEHECTFDQIDQLPDVWVNPKRNPKPTNQMTFPDVGGRDMTLLQKATRGRQTSQPSAKVVSHPTRKEPEMTSLFDGDGDGEGPAKDTRLKKQIVRVYEAMNDHTWWTLDQLYHQTGAPEASVSARIRDLRKERFGGFQIEHRNTGPQHEYRLVENTGNAEYVYSPLAQNTDTDTPKKRLERCTYGRGGAVVLDDRVYTGAAALLTKLLNG